MLMIVKMKAAIRFTRLQELGQTATVNREFVERERRARAEFRPGVEDGFLRAHEPTRSAQGAIATIRARRHIARKERVVIHRPDAVALVHRAVVISAYRR